ncbi:MAG: hypothetical protein JWP34_5071, partial [Massilia sp.]|nr:hypothetical protein [Massilia sp.]
MPMPNTRNDALRRHCVLPFGAEPRAVRDLRRAVDRQLAAWDASDVTDVAQLAVAELAANVIKHVGEGTAATLVMEDEDGRLRIEMHDTSPVLPTCRQASPDQEEGRGIALVAAVTKGWFSFSTATGKAVCCDLSYQVPKPANADTRERVSRAMAFVEAYALYWRSPETLPIRSAPAMDEVVTDLITDLICWLADKGYDPVDILDRAQTHFEAEQSHGGLMLEISDAAMAAIIAEFSPTAAEPMHGLDLEFLLHAAQHSGLLEALEVHHIFGTGSRDDWFIVTVQASPNIVLSSRVMRWHEVRPERPSGAEAIRHVLRCLDEIAREVLSAFSVDALLRTAPEMERMRELAREAGAIDEGWDEASAKYR